MAAKARSRMVLSRRVEEFARKSATAVRLEDLYRWGRGDVSTRLKMARFLRREVAVRNAQLCKELQLFPFGLAATVGVSEVVDNFSSYVDALAKSSEPKTLEDDAAFTLLLQSILEDQMNVIRRLGEGVREVRAAVDENGYEAIRSEVDRILDRFFMRRIGLRFLLEHHIQSAEVQPGVSGIIHSNVAVGPILRAAAEEARELCKNSFGEAPEVDVVGDGDGGDFAWGLGSLANLDLSHDRKFTYVPIHLRFSCSVILQNACFAVARKHGRGGSSSGVPLPRVLAIFSHGEEEVAVKVSDQGGGIPRSDLHLAWSYFDRPLTQEPTPQEEPARGRRHTMPLGSGIPPGVGLALARLHARYYGGDLVLKSIEGHGTDAYLFLNRLGHNCENLPQGVRVSPAMSDSSISEDAAIRLDSLVTNNELEAAFLARRLRDFRARQARSAASLPSSVTDSA